MTAPRPCARARLTPETLADDDALWAAIDGVSRGEPEVRRHSRGIIRRQQELRGLVGDDGWQAYLLLEHAVNSREEAVVTSLVRGAFEQGLHHGERRP